MKQIETRNAVGHILCHDITRIIKDEVKDTPFRKGHIVKEEDIPLLLDIGKENLYVWESKEGFLHENEAASILYEICAGENVSQTEVREGKIEVIADCDGLLVVNIEKLRAVNSIGEMMIATRNTYFPVKKGDKLAGTRVIPLVISEEKMKLAKDTAGDKALINVLKYNSIKAGIVTTGSEVYNKRIKDTFTPVIQQKLAEYGGKCIAHSILPDSAEKITAEVLKMIDEGAEMVLCTGGMSVDPDDSTPTAIKNTGAEVISYGAPVLPGAMILVAYYKDIPIIGLPGCVMYSKRTIFDIILPRIMSGLKITADELAGLGNGGLCLNCDVCLYPNCGFGKGV